MLDVNFFKNRKPKPTPEVGTPGTRTSGGTSGTGTGSVPLSGVDVESLKRAALETETDWRPAEIFFLRRTIPDATFDESEAAYWLAVHRFGSKDCLESGMTPEAAQRHAVNEIIRRRESFGNKEFILVSQISETNNPAA